MIRNSDQVPADILAALIEQSELYDTHIVPVYPRPTKNNEPRRGRLSSNFPLLDVHVSYIDADLFRHGLAELVTDDN